MTVVDRFCRHADENKRQKVALILDKLITMTIDEVEASNWFQFHIKSSFRYCSYFTCNVN